MRDIDLKLAPCCGGYKVEIRGRRVTGPAIPADHGTIRAVHVREISSRVGGRRRAHYRITIEAGEQFLGLDIVPRRMGGGDCILMMRTHLPDEFRSTGRIGPWAFYESLPADGLLEVSPEIPAGEAIPGLAFSPAPERAWRISGTEIRIIKVSEPSVAEFQGSFTTLPPGLWHVAPAQGRVLYTAQEPEESQTAEA